MVKVNKPTKAQLTSKLAVYSFVAVFITVVTSILSSSGGGGGTGNFLLTLTSPQQQAVLEPFDVTANARAMKEWRQGIRDQCRFAMSKEEVLAIDVLNSKGFRFPSDPPPAQPRGDDAVRRCQRVVLDFGANIGDTSGHIIDTGMIGCERKDLKASSQTTHFDVNTRKFDYITKRNRLTNNIAGLIASQNEGNVPSEKLLGPEDYCYYGIEGNPVFTQRLQKVEDTVMSLRPRPIRHMHFFTESVGAGEDGMTKLYLDTVNTKENFWGSSIFKDHQDVKKSIEQANGKVETIAADVMGYTIGTLMRKTFTAFDSDGNVSNEKNHLILKVDIEGGEYPLLDQAVKEGTLCKFVEAGNTADVFIEFHSQRVTGKHEWAIKKKSINEHLTKCGVNFRSLEAYWA